MTFSSIIKKNFIHNFNKYISFYFVNSLIITMLFMYGSLIFNETVLNSIGKSSLYETVNIALTGLIIFSIVFITYTNIAFLKNRGKEFGTYLTLGMTTKNLSKLIFIENIGIMTASLITGLIGGSLFSRLFYMGLNKILSSTPIPYKLNYKTFLLSIGVFSLIFIGNFIFNMFYIRKVSIIDSLKASKKKEIGKSNLLIGVLALILLIISLYCLPKTLLKDIFKNQRYMIGVFITLTITCPYIIIGSFISLLKSLLSKFPKLYNKNLLILSNLSHRFLAYKNILYMLSLLVAGSMFFVGYSYTMYTSTRESVSIDTPYDIMFVENSEFNKVSKEELLNNLTNSKASIKSYSILEYMEIPMFRVNNDIMTFWTNNQTLISESNYNKHMNTNIDVKKKSAIYAAVYNETMKFEYPTIILSPMNSEHSENLQELLINNNSELYKEQFESVNANSIYLEIAKENIKEKSGVPFVNNRHTTEYSLGSAFILDDSDYEMLVNTVDKEQIKKVHLMNIKNGDTIFNSLIKYLRNKNNLDDTYWKEGSLYGKTSFDERGIKEAYRPIYKEELIKIHLDNNGIMFFTLMFIGLLFMISNGIVLYYKVLSDIDDANERLTSLSRIGILKKEINSLISKELSIIFFIPILVGGGMGLYYLYVMLSNSSMLKLLMQKSIFILIIGILIQIIFYLISRKKYLKEISENLNL